MLLAAVTRYVCFALKALKLPVFSFELTLLTFSVSYLWIMLRGVELLPGVILLFRDTLNHFSLALLPFS